MPLRKLSGETPMRPRRRVRWVWAIFRLVARGMLRVRLKAWGIRDHFTSASKPGGRTADSSCRSLRLLVGMTGFFSAGGLLAGQGVVGLNQRGADRNEEKRNENEDH